MSNKIKNCNKYIFSFQLVGPNRLVNEVGCTCVAQAGKCCKHIYALIHYINTETGASKTSCEQSWGKPTGDWKDQYKKPLKITDTFKKPKKFANKTPMHEPYDLKLSDLLGIKSTLLEIEKVKHLNKHDLQMKSDLRKKNAELQSKQEEESILVAALNLICFATEGEKEYTQMHFVDENIVLFYNKHVKIDSDMIVKIFVETINQSLCAQWFLQRDVRLSASERPHRIKTCTKKQYEDLADDFLVHKDISNRPAVKYGRKYEKVAFYSYKKLTNREVLPSGLFIKPDKQFLCATPDGICVEDGVISKILEIKCPHTCAKKPIYDETNKKFNVKYLFKDFNEVTHLNINHKYYTQCQMQMYVCGLSDCDLFVWSPKKSEIVSVARDDKFLSCLIPKLEKFYFSYMVKAIIKKNIVNL